MDEIKEKFRAELDICIKKLSNIPSIDKDEKLENACCSNSKKRNNSIRKRNQELEKDIKDMKKL